jgi:hypothetical protein
MGQQDQRRIDGVQIPAVVNGDRQVEQRTCRLCPRNHDRAVPAESQFDVCGNGRGIGEAEDQLYPSVGIEHAEQVVEPVRGGDRVHDDQNRAFDADGRPRATRHSATPTTTTSKPYSNRPQPSTRSSDNTTIVVDTMDRATEPPLV